jgi:hypothetical protein
VEFRLKACFWWNFFIAARGALGVALYLAKAVMSGDHPVHRHRELGGLLSLGRQPL